MEIKPFKKLPLQKYFQHDLEKIMMAFRLSKSIREDLTNTRASGDEVELAVKNFFSEKLHPKYHVCDGHLVDKELNVSPQYDIIISENSKNPVLFDLSDKSELVYYDSVYCFGEVKRSFYQKDLVDKFSDNIKRTKELLNRNSIEPNFIETSNSGFLIETTLTSLPLRNPLLSFMFFIDSTKCNFSDLKKSLNTRESKELPNFIVFLDNGLIVNVDSAKYEKGEIKINLYPEFNENESKWVLFNIDDPQLTLTYQYMLLLEHLNNTLVKSPSLTEYTKNIFDFSITNFHEI